jgi:hypothetical protein
VSPRSCSGNDCCSRFTRHTAEGLDSPAISRPVTGMLRAWAFGVHRSSIARFVLLAGAFGAAKCGGEAETDSPPRACTDRSACGAVALPLAGGLDAPTASDVRLECQASSQLVVHVTIADRQGDADLQDTVQFVQVFKTNDCQGPVAELEDDLIGAGQETFGTAVERSEEPSLYDQICGCTTWPVRVALRDATGNTTTGVVDATVVP